MIKTATAQRLELTSSLEASLAEPLKALMHEFATPRQQIEGAFLAIGRDLIESNGVLAGITTTFAKLALDLEGGEAGDSRSPFETLAQRVIALSDEVASDIRDFGPLTTQVAAIRRPVNELQNAVKSIGLVALGTQISAAHLPGRHDFAAFTGDITHLSERASAAIKEFAAVYEQLVATLQAAATKQATLESTQKRVLHGLTERLEASLAAASLRHQQANAAGAEISGLFGRIAAGVTSIVTALQIGDITRQRVEHVEEGLALLLDPADLAAYAPDGNTAALVATVCRLQSAQAEQATKDFEQEAGRVVTLLRQLAADAAGIVARSRHIYEETVGASKAALASLAEEVRRACALMRGCQVARTELDAAAEAVTAALHDLMRCVRAVQEIKGGMHIIGINMALKCAWLGPEGDTLNVIAHELRELAGTTVIHANAAIARLDEATGQAEALTTTTARDIVEDVGRLEEDVRRAAAERSGDRQMAEALDLLIRDGTRVAQLLEQAVGRITIQQEIGGALRGLIAKIEGIRADAEAVHAATGSGDMQVAEARALERLKGRYTMASERVLHDQHLGLAGMPASVPPAAEASLDDIFF